MNDNSNNKLWTWADDELLVLIAISDIMWENKIRFYSTSDETKIQFKMIPSHIRRF